MSLSTLKREKLAQLELNRGGVAFVTKKSKVTPNPTVVISLGGLGGQTLNTLKGKFSKEIGESDHIYFRMIDTDRRSTDTLCKVKSDGTPNPAPNACLEQGEGISLYDPAIANLLMAGTIPPYIKNWLNDDLIGTHLDNNGAQQIRQIGRAMLANTTVYNAVRTKINTVLLDAIKKTPLGGNVDVILIAGVSGGTGSGTVIDLSYMIHDIFKSAGFTGYNLAGYIYTPDAQFKIPDIAADPAILQNLKKNGYSALKEIDYFMNIEETNSVYRLSLGTSDVVSGKDIFSSCTLISGYVAGGGLNDTGETINRLTDQLMDMLTDITVSVGGVTKQMSTSILSNQNAMLNAWFAGHRDRRRFHRYATYKYQVLGYNSIVIPRDEILAYCVNKIYERVIEEFEDFSRVNKDMMQKVYSQTSVIKPETYIQHAITVPSNPIDRNLFLDGGYTKAMLKADPMIAYKDACDMAAREKAKINGAYQTLVENELFNALSHQVDLLFNQYGPFVAMKAIEHRHEELTVGNPKEPFPGIVEMLELLGQKLQKRSNDANKAFENGGKADILMAAGKVTSRLLPGVDKADMSAYVGLCCEQAVTSKIDVFLFKTLSDAVNNVAVRMNKLNSELFDVYTNILKEIQRILNKDGQYFTKGITTQNGRETTFSVDIIKSGKYKAKRLEKYLDDFISTVSVQQLAQAFITTMRNNRDKWVAANNENDFDVVSEVRVLMDNCLINNQMTTDIIEKFVTVAYSPNDLTPDQLNAIWNNNSPDGPKIQALNAAANEIFNLLRGGAKPMANSRGIIPLSEYSGNWFISTLKDTPQLTNILNGIITKEKGSVPATSDSKDKFIFTQQYMSIPMYILLGMDEYNQTYVDFPAAGQHMDEKKQNWRRFPNPYTIDSVAIDLANKEQPEEDIQKYPDYSILQDVQKKTRDGVEKYGFVEIKKAPAGLVSMILHDIASKPKDMKGFKEKLYQALWDNDDLDIIAFMKNNGFVINPVNVPRGVTDIDFTILDFNQATPVDMDTIYKDIPVPVPDVYKWVRKSIKYMDILDKDTDIFQEIQDVVDKVKEDKDARTSFIRNVETFAYALRTGMVKRNETNPKLWNYMNGKEPVTVNFGRRKEFDRKYFLYHVFVSFQELDKKRLDAFNVMAGRMIDEGKEIDYTFIADHISEVLSPTVLGDVFQMDVVNEEAMDQGVTGNYKVTDLREDQVNPYNVLKRFYELLRTSF